MSKINKLFKTLLCACILFSGMMLNPVKAAQEETVTPYAAARSMEIPANTFVAFPVQKDGYALNYVFYYVSGTYVYNTSSSGNYITNANLTYTRINAVTATSPNFSSNGNGIYQVVSLTPQSYSAGSNFSIVVNYKLNLRLLNGTNLGLAYNSKSITGN